MQEQPLDEAQHMQPLLMDMLSAVSEAAGSPQILVDTHSSNYLKRPTGMIDCSGLASELVEWSQLVVPWEFKTSADEVVSLLGQLIDRCEALFHRQPQRGHVYAAGITMDAVEVYTISRDYIVERTGMQPLSIDSRSPGLRLVASVLQASFEQLGFSCPQLPSGIHLGSYKIGHGELIQQDSAPNGGHPDSFMFRVDVDGLYEPAVLKLSRDFKEVMHLILCCVTSW